MIRVRCWTKGAKGGKELEMSARQEQHGHQTRAVAEVEINSFRKFQVTIS